MDGAARARDRRDGHGRLVACQGPARPQARGVVALVLDHDPQSELVRSGDIRRCAVVDGALEDIATLERAVTLHEVDTVFHLGAQTIVGVAHRAPLAHLGGERSRHVQPARGLPPPRRPRAAGGRRLERQGLRRGRLTSVHGGIAARSTPSVRGLEGRGRPDRAVVPPHLRRAGRDRAVRQRLRRRRPELEPHRPGHDPLVAPRRAAGPPQRRQLRPRLPLRPRRGGGVPRARGR